MALQARHCEARSGEAIQSCMADLVIVVVPLRQGHSGLLRARWALAMTGWERRGVVWG